MNKQASSPASSDMSPVSGAGAGAGAVLVIDTETTGLSPRRPVTDTEAWERCRIVQIAWAVHQKSGELIEKQCYTVQPDGFIIPDVAANIHGISTAEAIRTGVPLTYALHKLLVSIKANDVETLVAHNMSFDYSVIQAEVWRLVCSKIPDAKELSALLSSRQKRCTMLMGTHPGKRWPKLAALYQELFDEVPTGCHKADADVEFCARIFFRLTT